MTGLLKLERVSYIAQGSNFCGFLQLQGDGVIRQELNPCKGSTHDRY